ncbi:MAG: nucleotidyltransferase family protein [Parcubacteria group bacterium]|jgi:bifunctional UDP-N-acetylglucosamine pyrophosphorylase/glucosamine-1-phosphate N-acetyltransferase
MQVVILASGKGKRMGDLTKTTPKPMLKIKGKPILEHKLNALPKEITEIILVIGYRGEQIMNHFKNSFNNKKITYIFRSSQVGVDGTAKSLHAAKSFLGDKFLVMMGDDFYHKKDIKNILKHELAVLGCEVDDISQFGLIKSKGSQLVDIIEKPKKSDEKLANTGLYVLNKKFFEYDLIKSNAGEYCISKVLSCMADKHKIKVEKTLNWFPIGNQGDLKKAEELIHKFA